MKMKNGTKTSGRPRTKGPLRNFKLRSETDSFLTAEAGQGGRTGKDMTLYLEQAIELLRKLKPAERDAVMSRAFSS